MAYGRHDAGACRRVRVALSKCVGALLGCQRQPRRQRGQEPLQWQLALAGQQAGVDGLVQQRLVIHRREFGGCVADLRVAEELRRQVTQLLRLAVRTGEVQRIDQQFRARVRHGANYLQRGRQAFYGGDWQELETGIEAAALGDTADPLETPLGGLDIGV